MPQYPVYATPRADWGEAMWEFYLNSADYIGAQVLGVKPTGVKAATYSKVTRESILRQRNVKRGSGDNYNRDDIELEDQAYACEEYGIELSLDQSKRNEFINDFDADSAYMAMSSEIIMNAMERRIAAAVFNTTTWTGAHLTTEASNWQNNSATIKNDVIKAAEKSRKLTGKMPDTMIINRRTLNYILNNDEIIDLRNVSEQSSLSIIRGSLPGIFGLEQILVGNAMTSTLDEGVAFSASSNTSYIWGNAITAGSPLAMICKTHNSLSDPGIGLIPHWTTDAPQLFTMETYWDEDRRANVYRCRQQVDEVIHDASFGHLLYNPAGLT